ncbi:MAG: phenylacetate--CoA ligase family protein [Calditrichaeota bacterium]|nr:MAG: phenylacetate--CoA ligase family protein [Calditrichota bacterium]
MPREALEKLQLDRLQKTAQLVYQKVPFYRDLWSQNGILPEDIKTFKDFEKLPFTTKTDMQASYPYKMFAVPMEEIIRIHASSGTTGQPTVVGYTRQDVETWAELIARLLTAGGVTKKDIVQVSFGYGLFTGGFGLHYGIEKIGAAVIPVSSGNTDRQLQIMREFGSTAIICTPSYAVYLGEVIEERNISRKSLSLRVGCFGAEPWTEAMRVEIEKRLNVSATDNYGLSEVMGPGVSYECGEKHGMHINEDSFIAEIIDPQTGQHLPDGEYGELVITTLNKEGIPVIRYRTRDITALIPEPCPCGRTFMRMTKPRGRSDDMLIIRGVNVFPSQVETILVEMEETEPQYQLVVRREGALDTLEIKTELNEKYFSDEMRVMHQLEEKIKMRVRNALGITAKITLVEPKTLERSTGKAKRVLDLREYL